MSRSLYEINAELDAIIQVIDRDDETFVYADEAFVRGVIDGWLDANKDEIKSKLDDYCAVIANKTAMATARKAEAKKLSQMAATDERIADMLKDRAKEFFARVGIDKLETLHFKPRIQANGGPLSVRLTEEDPKKLPEVFQRVTVTADVDLIRKTLEQGADLPFASLEPRGTHFRIR